MICLIISENIFKTVYALVFRRKNESGAGEVKVKGIVRKDTVHHCSVNASRILYPYVFGFYKPVAFHP